MGFGFNLFFVFILIPLTVILLAIWIVKKNIFFGKTLGLIWISIIVLLIVSNLTQRLTAKVLLKKQDFYGEYIIDKSFYPGLQTDWQYKHFKFVIKENDSLYFNTLDNNKIILTYHGKISTVKPYNSERLIIKMNQPTHHILTSNPTIYRNTRSFYLVFNSPKFGNVFFKKDK